MTEYNKARKTLAGFTIVEIMIVLAIAGVIMSIVFLAVPQLQRSSRNSQRDADASRILSAVNDCLSNNNGDIAKCLPLADNANASTNTYGTTTPVLSSTSGYLDLSKIRMLNTINVFKYDNTTAGFPTDTATAYVYAGNVCSNGNPTTTNAGTNSFVVLFKKEQSANICFSP